MHRVSFLQLAYTVPTKSLTLSQTQAEMNLTCSCLDMFGKISTVIQNLSQYYFYNNFKAKKERWPTRQWMSCTKTPWHCNEQSYLSPSYPHLFLHQVPSRKNVEDILLHWTRIGRDKFKPMNIKQNLGVPRIYVHKNNPNRRETLKIQTHTHTYPSARKKEKTRHWGAAFTVGVGTGGARAQLPTIISSFFCDYKQIWQTFDLLNEAWLLLWCNTRTNLDTKRLHRYLR